jgi:fatty-acyl-CoA synthase
MMYVNDEFYDNQQFGEFYRQFDSKPEISHCRGRRLAVCLNNTAQWIALVLYVKERGGAVVPLHPTLPLEAARRTAAEAESHILIYQSLDNIELLHPTAHSANPGLVQFSSGSTGAPKRIERSWQDIDEEIKHYNVALHDAAQFTPVVTCPITHSYGLLCGVLSAFKRGVQPRILTELNPKYVMKKLRHTEQPLLYSSPTMLNVLTKLLPADESLHAVMTSGSVLPQPQFEQLSGRTQYLMQQYGCSEAGCIAINTHTKQASAQGQVLAHLQLETSHDPADPAEIIVRKNGQAINTQDLGYVDENQVLHFVSRLDDTINVAGINVYPQEVENIVLTYPGVQDAVVFKKPDDFAGERVCLKFVAHESLSLTQLRQWASSQLSPYQLPVDMEQVDHIERLANGKVNRRLLSAQFAPVNEEMTRKSA